MDWPAATGRGRVWKTGVFLSANNRKMEAFGTLKAIRGISHGPYRPDFVFIDDIENDDNVRQVKQRNKLEQLITSSVLNLGPPDGSMDVLYVHTVLHHDSVANRFHSKP
ncbi:MAG: hypothetical protein HC788_12955, partial [Sphingopyxis sp.]|nr:hypothetical protein [Sphingopyxis sp.]